MQIRLDIVSLMTILNQNFKAFLRLIIVIALDELKVTFLFITIALVYRNLYAVYIDHYVALKKSLFKNMNVQSKVTTEHIFFICFTCTLITTLLQQLFCSPMQLQCPQIQV